MDLRAAELIVGAGDARHGQSEDYGKQDGDGPKPLRARVVEGNTHMFLNGFRGESRK
jgi:hypothetical protein